jgi:hypothetical protein
MCEDSIISTFMSDCQKQPNGRPCQVRRETGLKPANRPSISARTARDPKTSPASAVRVWTGPVPTGLYRWWSDPTALSTCPPRRYTRRATRFTSNDHVNSHDRSMVVTRTPSVRVLLHGGHGPTDALCAQVMESARRHGVARVDIRRLKQPRRRRRRICWTP